MSYFLPDELKAGIIVSLEAQLPQDVLNNLKTKEAQIEAITLEAEALENQLASNPIYQHIQELKELEEALEEPEPEIG